MIQGKTKGFGEAIVSLRQMAARGADPTPFLSFVGYWMAYNNDGVKHEFDTLGEGSWARGPKLRRGELLRDTRTMERSISYKVVGKTNVSIGSNDFVLYVHQHGMTIKAKTEKGLRFIGQSDTTVEMKRGASLRRAPKPNAKTGKWGKLPEGLRWYRLMQVTIPQRIVLVFRDQQKETIAGKYLTWISKGGGITAAPFQSGNPNPSRPGKRRT